VGRQQAQQQARAGAAVAHVEHLGGLGQAADAGAEHAPRRAGPGRRHHLGAERGHRRGGGQHVGALEQVVDDCLADRDGADHQGAVRDRLVARHAHPAGERAAGMGDQA